MLTIARRGGRVSVGSRPYRGSMTTPEPVHTAPGGDSGQDRPFSAADFVIVDVETTGWDPEVARITEIAAVRVRGGQTCEVFSSLVDPGCPIPGPVADLTNITDALVAGAPRIADVLPGFLGFARGAVLAAHNAAFDVGFLTAGCRACGLAWPDFTVLDTVAVARATLRAGEVPDCKLSTLARHFGSAVTPSHRALPDALATADVLDALLGRLAAAGVCTFTDLSSLLASSPPPGPAAGARPPGRRRRLARVRRWARKLTRLTAGHAAGPGR